MNDSAPLSVLLVEDAAPVRQRLCALIAEIPSLRLIGQAATVAEASSFFDTAEPTAVVLDLGLPDGTGIDILRHVRETNSKCVVIILSNYLDPETYNRCSELGADFLFSKSDEFEQAIETLRALSNGTEKGMQERPDAERVRRAKLAVTSGIGIHARPAAMLVKLAQSFDADIEISLNGHAASAKSILGVLTLGAGYGAEVKVAAVGADADRSDPVDHGARHVRLSRTAGCGCARRRDDKRGGGPIASRQGRYDSGCGRRRRHTRHGQENPGRERVPNRHGL